MRTLIFGGTGMLGRAVAAEGRRRRHPVLALSHAQGDITDPARVAYWVEAFRPQVLINCAAFTRVDACEEERDRAFEVNARGVAHVATAAERSGARLVHISTDYVFDGEAREPYPEQSQPRPLSVYGESKLRGEEEALKCPGALVVRTSWLFGPGSSNFVTAMLGQIERGQNPLRVVDDQVGCPTYTRFLSTALWDLASLKVTGLLHYRNREPVSWCGFTREIVALARPEVEVVPITTGEFPRPARRPAYSVLDVSRIEGIRGRRVEPWGWGLVEYLEALRGTAPAPRK